MPTIFGKALGEYGQIKVRPRNCKGYRYICSSESFEGVRIQILRPRTLGHRCGREGQLPLIGPLCPEVPGTAGSSAGTRGNVLQGAAALLGGWPPAEPTFPRRLFPMASVSSSPAARLRLQRPLKFTIGLSRNNTCSAGGCGTETALTVPEWGAPDLHRSHNVATEQQSGITLALFLDSPVATERWRRKQEKKWAITARGSRLCPGRCPGWDGLPDKLSSRCSVRGMRWESSETLCQQAYKHQNCEVFMKMLVSRLGGLVLRQRWNRCQQRCPVRAFVCKARHSVETR
ncbi:uncharacterized protein [Molothrus aeneus]|uniref:uncharacterized protein n=1 Tax=Molothrus aeneus TaxID=84833 RepID=UPI0034577DEC